MIKQILLIEDDRLISKSLARLLTGLGLIVKVADDSSQAYKFSSEQKFDLIISDIKMPGESGVAIVRKINEQKDPPIPSIFITAYAESEFLQEAKKLGCVDFLYKPIDSAVLVQTLEKQFDTKLDFGDSPVIAGQPPPSRLKKYFYNALSSQWNPAREIEWNDDLGLAEDLYVAMTHILSPIIAGEYSAFSGIPPRISHIQNYEISQYLAAQLVDETRHAEAFDLYLLRIKKRDTYKKLEKNRYILQYFGYLKRLQDDDHWIVGLLVTEITSRILLESYMQKNSCRLTNSLFRLVLLDEARHVSFSTYYLKEILKATSKKEREDLVRLTQEIMIRTGRMLEHFHPALKTFQLDSSNLYNHIVNEITDKVNRHILLELSSL